MNPSILRAFARRAELLTSLGLAGSASLGLGCGADFDPGSELDGLRVLAVQKSVPYARPGSRVDLELLWHDTDDRPPPQIAWLAACQNPPGDLFETCFQVLPQGMELDAEGAAALGASLAGRFSLPDAAAGRANDRFSFTIARDIISARPPPKDPTTVPYGLDYVLFAACAGTLTLETDREFPFVCYLEQDDEPGLSPGDTELGPRDFVVGYSAVFSYQELANDNPRVTGLQWGDLLLSPGEAPLGGDGTPLDGPALGPDDLCIGDACAPAPAVAEPGVCPEALTLDACPDDCGDVELGLIVDPASAETDSAASSLRSQQLLEQMWINYYVSDGEVSQEVRLLNDAARGWNDDPSTDYTPGEEPGVAYLWSVAHDNRGGSEWARLRVCTR